MWITTLRPARTCPAAAATAVETVASAAVSSNNLVGKVVADPRHGGQSDASFAHGLSDLLKRRAERGGKDLSRGELDDRPQEGAPHPLDDYAAALRRLLP